MAFRTHTITHRVIRRTAALAALSLATFACGGTRASAASPQQHKSTDAVRALGSAAERHPLDEATVRKVVAIMRAWKPAPPPPPRGEDAKDMFSVIEYDMRNRFSFVVQQELADRNSTATIDGTAPLKAAIVSQGLSSREFVLALLAFQAARFNDGVSTSLKGLGGQAPELPPILKQNIEVIRRVGPTNDLTSGW